MESVLLIDLEAFPASPAGSLRVWAVAGSAGAGAGAGGLGEEAEEPRRKQPLANGRRAHRLSPLVSTYTFCKPLRFVKAWRGLSSIGIQTTPSCEAKKTNEQ